MKKFVVIATVFVVLELIVLACSDQGESSIPANLIENSVSASTSSFTSPNGYLLAVSEDSLIAYLSRLVTPVSISSIDSIAYYETSKYSCAKIVIKLSSNVWVSVLTTFRKADDIVFFTDNNSVILADIDTVDNPTPKVFTIGGVNVGGAEKIEHVCGDWLSTANCGIGKFCDWKLISSEHLECGCHGINPSSVVMTTSGGCSIKIK